MPWFYNSYSGELTHASGVDALAYQAAIHTGTGWHELRIADSASEAQAAAEAVREVPGGTTPTTSLVQGAANVPGAAAKAAGASGIPGLSQIGDFFSKLGQANTWLRVAEVLLGTGLIIVALARLASGTPIGRAAVKAGKAAAIL